VSVIVLIKNNIVYPICPAVHRIENGMILDTSHWRVDEIQVAISKLMLSEAAVRINAKIGTFKLLLIDCNPSGIIK